jgi:hypothetical protein
MIRQVPDKKVTTDVLSLRLKYVGVPRGGVRVDVPCRGVAAFDQAGPVA